MKREAVLKKFQEYVNWYVKKYGSGNPNLRPIYEIWTMSDIGGVDVNADGKPNGWPSATVEYIGWYPNVEDAVDAVLENRCDIWETCYEGAMVICRYPGLYVPGSNVNRQMFKWNMATMQYEPLESEPDIYAHISY